MSLFFHSFTFAIICGTGNSSQQTSLQCPNNQHGIQRRRQDLGKKFLFEGYTAKRLIDEFPGKSWTKRGVNKLLKSCGTQAQLKGGQAAADRTVPTLKKTLRQLMI